ncbi:helix-turn-helix domain-containing protein [Aquitalea sp. ASV11]|uniref:helix-turn-helix domain-containing protein n=1 Tax=Aquitalea sp. ASV11 TaxID=2795103 RepID=UPI0018EB6D32|nr:helix-turn-helix domain-containing protein [Aquitalea sp. ASV11]
MSPPVIAVLAFQHISPFHLSVPCVVFGDAHPDMPAFTLRVCAVDAGPIRTSAGFSIACDYGLEGLDGADIIILPSWQVGRPVPDALVQALQQASHAGVQIVGLCLGAYVLAEAGLLDGRNATTHWAYAEDFASRYPQVRLDPAVLYVEDGQLLTSAGTAAGLDCCLHLLRQRYGAELANGVARRLVVPPHRQGGQAQFIAQPLPVSAGDARLAALLDWVRANLAQTHTLDSLAARMAMSRRSFTRHFRQLTGSTVGQWLVSERLRYSQRLLESTEYSVEQVAALAGFGSAAALRHHFRLHYGVSPMQWQQNFQS